MNVAIQHDNKKHIEINGVLARSPFKTISATKNYLLSLTSAADIDFYHIPEEFQKDLMD